MAARTRFGGLTRHAGSSARGAGLRCIRCGLTIFYGERCERCKQELRQRKQRKPR